MKKSSRLNEATTTPEPAFHIRQLKASDARDVVELELREVQCEIAAIAEAPNTLDQIKQMAAICSNDANRMLEFFVAETDIPKPSRYLGCVLGNVIRPCHNYLAGLVMVLPYRPTIGASQPKCMSRTGSMMTIMGAGAGAGVAFKPEFLRKVQAALINHAVTACGGRGSRYRTLVAELSYREDEPSMQDNLYTFQEEGFQVIGKLEAVMEKDGFVFDRVFLQKHV